MHFITKASWLHIGLWLGWFVALLALAWSGALPLAQRSCAPPLAGSLTPAQRLTDPPTLALVVCSEARLPWSPRGRWRKWALARWQAARRA